MLRKLASSVLLAAVLGIVVAPAQAATEVFSHEWNFDASDNGVNPTFFKIGTGTLANKTIFTAGAGTHLPSGSTVNLLGPYGNDGASGPLANQAAGVYATVGTSGDVYDGVSVSFQLWVINTWDGNSADPTLGPDFFQVGVSGGDAGAFVAPATACAGTSLLCESFQNGAGTQSYPGSPTYNGYLGGGGSFNPGFGNIAPDGYSIYTITLTEVPVTPVGGQLTIYFRGWQNQATADESWAISNLKVTALQLDNGGPGPGPGPGPAPIPEPSTMLLGGLGLAFIALAGKRYRKN